MQFFYYFLLMANFVPVSLYVSMSTVKFFQAKFIEDDLLIYHEQTDTPTKVRTMALNEELGQISHGEVQRRALAERVAERGAE